jgi:hypothetical protein
MYDAGPRISGVEMYGTKPPNIDLSVPKFLNFRHLRWRGGNGGPKSTVHQIDSLDQLGSPEPGLIPIT